jgi:hypothetical protein
MAWMGMRASGGEPPGRISGIGIAFRLYKYTVFKGISAKTSPTALTTRRSARFTIHYSPGLYN